MPERVLVCVDPDAIDTHKGLWLEVESFLDGIVSVRDDESRGRMIAPEAGVVPDPSACEPACVGGWA